MKELVPMNDYGIFASSKYEVMVDSRFVAEAFEKEHKDVLKAIRKILENSGFSKEFARRNFAQSSYVNEQNKKQPCLCNDERWLHSISYGFYWQKS